MLIAIALPVVTPVTEVVMTNASTMSPAAQATLRVNPVPLLAV